MGEDLARAPGGETPPVTLTTGSPNRKFGEKIKDFCKKTFKVALATCGSFIPIILAALLKIAFIDDIPKDDVIKQRLFLIDQYAKPLWLELIVAAYLIPIGAIIARKFSPNSTTALFSIPFGTFIMCIVFIQALPKFSLGGNITTIIVPDALAIICLFIINTIVFKSK